MRKIIQKVVGYALIIFGIVFLAYSLIGGTLMGAMSSDAGDTSYVWPIIITSGVIGLLGAFIFIKIGWKLRSNNSK